MSVRHEILKADASRTFVRVNDTWYDTSRELYPQVGQPFLIGSIEEVMEYDKYMKLYGKFVKSMYEEVSEKTQSGGFIRKSEGGRVVYAINPVRRLYDDDDMFM